MNTTRSLHSSKQPLFLILLLALALPLAVRTGAEVISDFDDGLPDWESEAPAWFVPGSYFGNVVFEEVDGHLNMQLTAPWSGSTTWKRSLTIANEVSAEVRLDVVRSPNFAFGTVGLMGSAGDKIEVGYCLWISPWWVAVCEYQIDYRKPASGPVDNVAEYNLLIPFIENLQYSSVTFGMALTGVGDAVKITLSVWDHSPDRKLLFRQSVVDSVRPGRGSLDLPFKSFSHISISMHQLPSTTFPDSMAVDNLEFDYHPASAPPAVNAVRTPEGIMISWPLAQAADMILEMTDTLPNGTWSPVATEPTVSGDQKQVTVEGNGPSRYFRLRSP